MSSRRFTFLRRSLLVVSLLVITSARPTIAQTVFNHSGGDPNHSGYSVLGGESVDPASGALSLTVTDLALTGHAGLGLSVTRVYSSKFQPNFENGDHTPDERSWVGIGWRLHFGRVINPDATGGGETQIEMPDGSRHALWHSTAVPEGWMTSDFWVYDRALNRLKLPNGRVYTFGHLAEPNGLIGAARYVTEIRDPFNNTITFEYFAAPGPTDGVSRIRQYAPGGSYREVSFTYHAATNTLATMNFLGRVWTYATEPSGVAGHRQLTTVTPPVGPGVTYEYSPGPELSALAAPGGGRVDYVYATATRIASSLTQSSRVVATRTLSGWGVTPGTWTFTYSTGANADETVVDCPCGTTVYTFGGTGHSGDFSAWRSGTLVSRIVKNGSQVMESEQLTWQRSEAISADPVPGVNGVWADPAVYRALLAQRVVTRGPHSWTTTYSYPPGNFDNYGRATQIVEVGERTRTTTISYASGFAAYLLNRVGSTTVQIGSETRSSSWTYNTTNGFQTGENIKGIQRTFAPTSSGNIGTITDAHGHQTTYTYAYGVWATMTTPLLAVTRSIGLDDTVAWERIENGANSLKTSFTYDALGRLLTVQPPGPVNPIVHEYDNLSNRYLNVSRGANVATTGFNGLGQAISARDPAGVREDVGLDPCGRVVWRSYPYTNGPVRGTSVTVDALGRPGTVTDVDGTITTFAYNGHTTTVTEAVGQPEQRVTSYVYAAAGNPNQRLLSSVVDPAGATTAYQHNVSGLLTRVEGPLAGLVRQWQYDTRDLLTSETHPESGQTTFVYDVGGLRTQITNAKGTVTNLGYDANDRLTSRQYPSAEVESSFFQYDALGRVDQIYSGIVTLAHLFDAATGRLVRKTVNSTWPSIFAYDGNDNLTSVMYPSGRVVTYTYALDRVTSVSTGGQVVADQFTFSDGGHLASYRTGGATHLIDYDARDRMARLRSGPPGAPVLDLTYGYNRLSLATSILDSRGGVNQTHTYGYDALGRLTAVNGPSGARTLSYDAAGNRTGYTDPTGSYTYTYDPATNRLAWSSATNESFTYDATGAMTTDGLGIYEWKPTGLLAHVATPGPWPQGLANYSYDGFGQRVNRYSYASNTWRVWLRAPGGLVLTEYDVDANTNVYTWARDNLYIGNRLIGAVKAPSGQLEFYGKDLVDSIRVTFNADGSVFGRSDYAPFGADQSLTGGVPPYRFNSQRREGINDLDYFNARFYRPRLGRFHSVDPALSSGSLVNPQLWNRYAYSLNNPLTLSDPSGLEVRGRGPGGRSDCFVTSYDHWWCPGDNGQGTDNGGIPGDRSEYERGPGRGPGGGGGGGEGDGDDPPEEGPSSDCAGVTPCQPPTPPGPPPPPPPPPSQTSCWQGNFGFNVRTTSAVFFEYPTSLVRTGLGAMTAGSMARSTGLTTLGMAWRDLIRGQGVANLSFVGTIGSVAANSVVNGLAVSGVLLGSIVAGSAADATVRTYVFSSCMP